MCNDYKLEVDIAKGILEIDGKPAQAALTL